MTAIWQICLNNLTKALRYNRKIRNVLAFAVSEAILPERAVWLFGQYLISGLPDPAESNMITEEKHHAGNKI